MDYIKDLELEWVNHKINSLDRIIDELEYDRPKHDVNPLCVGKLRSAVNFLQDYKVARQVARTEGGER